MLSMRDGTGSCIINGATAVWIPIGEENRAFVLDVEFFEAGDAEGGARARPRLFGRPPR